MQFSTHFNANVQINDYFDYTEGSVTANLLTPDREFVTTAIK